MEDKYFLLTAREKKKIKEKKIMINLIYIIITPLILIVLVLIVSVNKIRKDIYTEIHKIRDISTIEEKYFTIPYVLAKYYSHIIDIRRNLTSSLMSKSYWHENIELYITKKLESDKKEFNKINAKIGLVSALVVYSILMIFWSSFERLTLNYQKLKMRGSNIVHKDHLDKIAPEILFIFSLDMFLGLDALSLPFVLLTGFIIPIVFLSNWTTIDQYNDYYVVIILGLEMFLLGVFLVIDLIMFYIFFESILPLLFVLIGLYGATQKFRAGYYLFLYTLFGSLFMLLSFVKLGGDTASTFFESYSDENTFQLLQQIVWTVLFVSFSVKTPLVPVHIWLPLAHSDANVSGSIILASIVLKLALYGFIRILIGIFYLATARLTSFFLGYCSMSLLFSSFTTIRQFDLKVLVAYSSIAHMASSLLGTFSDTLYGLIGSIIFGLAHGFVSPGLFIIVGAVLYDRCGTRIMNYFKGLSNILPFLALIFLILVFGNMGVPLTGNFIGEFLSLLGAYQQNIFIATIGTISVITSAIYSINTYNKTTSGSMSPYILTIPDIFRKEYYTLLPLIVLTLILGIYPSFISSDIEFGLSSNLMLIPILGISRSDSTENVKNTKKSIFFPSILNLSFLDPFLNIESLVLFVYIMLNILVIRYAYRVSTLLINKIFPYIYDWLVENWYNRIKPKFVEWYKITKVKLLPIYKNKITENIYIHFSVIFSDKLIFLQLLPLTSILLTNLSPDLIISPDFWYNSFSALLQGDFSRIGMINPYQEYIVDPDTANHIAGKSGNTSNQIEGKSENTANEIEGDNKNSGDNLPQENTEFDIKYEEYKWQMQVETDECVNSLEQNLSEIDVLTNDYHNITKDNELAKESLKNVEDLQNNGTLTNEQAIEMSNKIEETIKENEKMKGDIEWGKHTALLDAQVDIEKLESIKDRTSTSYPELSGWIGDCLWNVKNRPKS
jgi:NADH-ubiquinone oxidoreductase chain 4